MLAVILAGVINDQRTTNKQISLYKLQNKIKFKYKDKPHPKILDTPLIFHVFEKY